METVMNHHGQLQCSISQPWSPFAHCKHALVRQGIHTPRRAGSHRVFRLHATVFVRNNLKAAEKEDELEPETEGSSKKLIKFLGTRQSTPKDSKVVFVAGATGKVGSRTVRELLKFGFQVRASARNVEKAETLFQDVLENITTETEPEETNPISRFWPAKLFAFLKPKPVTPQLDIVECDLEDVESIAPALGNAGVVVCCIGASEKEIFDITGPYRIDYKATENLINAASAAEVNHFVLLTSLGTQKFGFPAAVLNLFWGVLLWKAKAEKALIESGLPYTIVRPGGMERPTDSYKETHNLALAEADKLFGGQVSNLQVAELIASIVKNPDISKDKIVEVVAETTAPLRPIRELLEEIPASGTPTAPIPQRENPRPIISVNQKEESKVLNNASEDEKLELKALKKRYEEEMEAAKEIENEARAALAEKAELEARAAEVRAKAEAAALAASRAKALEAAILAAARKGNVLSSEEKQRIMESVKTQKSEDLKDESKGIFSFFKLPTLGTETVSDDNGSIGSQPPVVEPREEVEEPVVAKIVEKKEESKKEQGAQKLAQLDAEIALEGRKKEEQERAEKEARDLEEKEAKRVEEEERKAANKKKEAEEAVVAEAVAAAEKEKEKAKQPKQQSNAVLSPYAGFPGLKPPRPPAPSPPASKREQGIEPIAVEQEAEPKAESDPLVDSGTGESDGSVTGSVAGFETGKSSAQESAAREEEALAKARAATSFVWPWQKPKPLENEVTEEAVPPVPETVTKIPSSSSRPLSPYAQFPDLKPPSPPRASLILEAAPTSSSSSSSLSYSSTPLSPYAGFPELKPPSPPRASPPGQIAGVQAAEAQPSQSP